MSGIKLAVVGVLVGMWLASCAFCLYLGWQHGRNEQARTAVRQYQTREKSDEKAGFLFGVDLCIANGGLRQQCIADVRRLEAGTKAE